MDGGVAGLLEDTCAVFSLSLVNCTFELTCNPLTSDSMCTYTEQKLFSKQNVCVCMFVLQLYKAFSEHFRNV